MFELDPMNELKVGTDVQLKTIIKSVDSENEPTIWYAQVREMLPFPQGFLFNIYGWTVDDFVGTLAEPVVSLNCFEIVDLKISLENISIKSFL